MIVNLTEKRRAALKNAARICREVTAFDEAKIIEDMLAELDDIVVVHYHPDAYWKEYQQDQTYEKMTRWLKHRAWYLWMQEEARRIVSERDMHMAMLPTAKRDMLEDFSQGLMDAARRTDRGCQ